MHARILQRLAERPEGCTEAELREALYGAGAKTKVSPELSKLRKELGGLLRPASRHAGETIYAFAENIEPQVIT